MTRQHVCYLARFLSTLRHISRAPLVRAAAPQSPTHMVEKEDGGGSGGGGSELPLPVLAEAPSAEEDEEVEGAEVAMLEGAEARAEEEEDASVPGDTDTDTDTDTDGSGVSSGSDHGGDDRERRELFSYGKILPDPVKVDPAFPFGQPAESLTAAAMHGDVEAVRRFMHFFNTGTVDIDNGGVVNRARTSTSGETALALAVRYGHAAVVRAMLDPCWQGTVEHRAPRQPLHDTPACTR